MLKANAVNRRAPTRQILIPLFAAAWLAGCQPEIMDDAAVNTVRVPTLDYAGAAGTTGAAGATLSISPTTLNDGGDAITYCGLKPGSANAGSFPGTLSIHPATCVISGTPTAALSPTSFTLVATNSAGQSADASVTLTVIPGAAAKLAFATSPSASAQAGASLGSVSVRVLDAFNNLVTGSTASVSLAFGNNAGSGTLSGTTVAAAVNGIATFTGLSVNRVAMGYTLAASSGGLSAATSTSFNITPGPASALVFTTQPAGTVSPGAALATQPVVEIRDAQGNVVTSASSQITLTPWLDPSCNALPGTGPLAGHQVSALAGVATFTALTDAAIEAVYLQASDGTRTVCSSGMARFQEVPAQLAGLKLWLKADSLGQSNGSAVSSWSDSSGNGFHATQSTAAKQPTFRAAAINDRPTVRFDGTDDYLFSPALGLTGSRSIFVVFKPQVSTSDFYLLEQGQPGTAQANFYLWWDHGGAVGGTGTPQIISGFQSENGGGWRDYGAATPLSTTTPSLWESHFNTTANLFELYAGGTLLRSAPESLEPDTSGTQSLLIGTYRNASSLFFAGDLAEILIYDDALSASQRKKVECYLASKYALALDAAVDCSSESPAPAAPSGLTATAASDTRIDLSWTASPSASVTGYQIERCPDANADGTCDSAMAPIATVSRLTTSFASTGLTASTRYLYRVRAYTAGGNSAYTANSAATTQAGPVLLADSVADFSSSQAGPWQYGTYASGNNAATFTTATLAWTVGWGSWNGFEGMFTPGIWSVGNHPGCNGGTVVRRWVSLGTYPSVTISGNIHKDNTTCGYGTYNYVIVNGTSLYSLQVAWNDGVGASYSVNTSLNPGDTVDFATGVDNACNCGATYFTGQIFQNP